MVLRLHGNDEGDIGAMEVGGWGLGRRATGLRSVGLEFGFAPGWLRAMGACGFIQGEGSQLSFGSQKAVRLFRVQLGPAFVDSGMLAMAGTCWSVGQ